MRRLTPTLSRIDQPGHFFGQCVAHHRDKQLYLVKKFRFSGGHFAGHRRPLELACRVGKADRNPPLWTVHVSLGRGRGRVGATVPAGAGCPRAAERLAAVPGRPPI